MLNRSHRFHGYGSLRRAYSNGRTIRDSYISLRYAERQPGKPYRVAIVVSRKVNKSAVTRNRIRRRVYEIVRKSELVPPSTDLIFTVFSDIVATIEAERLSTIINELLTKTTLQQKKSL